jgi:DNA-binding NarL/FixJ family response regulator
MSLTVVETAGGAGRATEAISVLVADDHPLMLSGIRRALDDAADIDVIGEAHSGPQLLNLVERRKPNLVLMDMHMPGMSGIECIAAIRALSPDVKIAVLSASDDERLIEAATEAGANAYLVKSITTADLPAVVRQVVSGGLFMGGARRSAGRRPEAPRQILTDREQSVLAAVAAGMTTAQVSQQLWLSEHTVKFHLTNIYRKLGVRNRAGAIRVAFDNGLNTLPDSLHDVSPS